MWVVITKKMEMDERFSAYTNIAPKNLDNKKLGTLGTPSKTGTLGRL